MRGDVLEINLANLQMDDNMAIAWARWAKEQATCKYKRDSIDHALVDASRNKLGLEGLQQILAATQRYTNKVKIIKAFRNQLEAIPVRQILEMDGIEELHFSHNCMSTSHLQAAVEALFASGTFPKQHTKCPLWLRLECNPGCLLTVMKEHRGGGICVVNGKTDCNSHWCAGNHQQVPAIHLTYVDKSGSPASSEAIAAIEAAAGRSVGPSFRPKGITVMSTSPLSMAATPGKSILGQLYACIAPPPGLTLCADYERRLPPTSVWKQTALRTKWTAPPGIDPLQQQSETKRPMKIAHLAIAQVNYSAEAMGYLSVHAGDHLDVLHGPEAGDECNIDAQYFFAMKIDEKESGWVPSFVL
jgi:hypothetical protein